MALNQRSMEHCESELQKRTVAQLKSIARAEGLPVSGTKIALQDRISQLLGQYLKNGRSAQFSQLRSLISPQFNAAASGLHNHASAVSSAGILSSNFAIGSNDMRQSHSVTSSFQAGSSSMRLNFKDSPFYTILQSLTPVKECPDCVGGSDSTLYIARESTRDTVSCPVQLPRDVATAFSPSDSGHEKLKVMLFCSADPPAAHHKADVGFPNQIDVKIDGQEVRANFRGLKNRPGSTRPADITDLITGNLRSQSELTVSYALTNKPFFLIVNLVEAQTSEQLVSKLLKSKSISKDQVLNEMRNKAQDNDVEATSTTMSLKCPLSTLRMSVPCRSTICSHNQCFDALSFIQLQQQAPTWTCPICSKAVSFELLQVDKYVSSILDSTSSQIDQVTVEPDGKWTTMPLSSTPKGYATHSDEADGDVIEIREHGARKRANFPTPSSRTPTISSREPSITSTAKSSSGSKRTHSATIDLTLSSDDEDGPRESKRVSLVPRQSHESQSRKTSGAIADARGDPHSTARHDQNSNASCGQPQHPFGFDFPR